MHPLIHAVTLRFPAELEREFAVDYFHKSIRQVRIAQIVGAAVYAAFAIIDPWVVPDVTPQIWLIRAIVIANFALVFAATFARGFQRWMEPATTGVVFAAGVGLVGMMIIAPFPERELYFAGVMLVVLAGYTFMKLRFVPATAIAALLWVAYDVVDLFIRDTPLPIQLINNFYLLGANMVG